MEVKYDTAKVIVIMYTDHLGIHTVKRIVPEYLWWGTLNGAHKDGWMLCAYDTARDAQVDLAWSGINTIAQERIVNDPAVPLDESRAERFKRAMGRSMSSAQRAVATSTFYEWLIAHNHPGIARKFVEVGLMDDRHV